MREVTERGLNSVLERLRKQCDRSAGKHSFKFSNLDDSVDFYLCMASVREHRYELRLVIDVFEKGVGEDDINDIKHPAVWAWLMDRYDGTFLLRSCDASIVHTWIPPCR